MNYKKITISLFLFLSCANKNKDQKEDNTNENLHVTNHTFSDIPLKPEVRNIDPNDISFPTINVIDSRLDDNFCKNGTFYKDDPNEKNQPLYIVVHYAVSQTIPNLISTFYERGVSSHYGVDQYGKIYSFVPTKFKGFHAGVSAFRDKKNLNGFSIGIETVHPGYVEKGKTYNPFWKKVPTKKVEGEFWENLESKSEEEVTPGEKIIHVKNQKVAQEREWFEFPEQQFKALVKLIKELQNRFHILPTHVISHCDGAPDRKVDIGPMFSFKKAFEEHGVGYWPQDHKINLEDFLTLTKKDFVRLLKLYGWRKQGNKKKSDVIRAFQIHFYPECITGNLKRDETKKRILNLIVDYYHLDEETEYHQDFKDRLDELANDAKFSGLKKYLITH